MIILTDDTKNAADTEFDEAARRGRAVAEAMALPAERRSDQEAFGAFVLATTVALANRKNQNDGVKLVHSNGRGVLQKDLRDRLIFYLNDGFLIFNIFPLPGLSVFSYRRNVKGQPLGCYQFFLNDQMLDESEMAKHIVALAQ